MSITAAQLYTESEIKISHCMDHEIFFFKTCKFFVTLKYVLSILGSWAVENQNGCLYTILCGRQTLMTVITESDTYLGAARAMLG